MSLVLHIGAEGQPRPGGSCPLAAAAARRAAREGSFELRALAAYIRSRVIS